MKLELEVIHSLVFILKPKFAQNLDSELVCEQRLFDTFCAKIFVAYLHTCLYSLTREIVDNVKIIRNGFYVRVCIVVPQSKHQTWHCRFIIFQCFTIYNRCFWIPMIPCVPNKIKSNPPRSCMVNKKKFSYICYILDASTHLYKSFFKSPPIRPSY